MKIKEVILSPDVEMEMDQRVMNCLMSHGFKNINFLFQNYIGPIPVDWKDDLDYLQSNLCRFLTDLFLCKFNNTYFKITDYLKKCNSCRRIFSKFAFQKKKEICYICLEDQPVQNNNHNLNFYMENY